MTVTKILVPLVLVLAIVLTLHLVGVFEPNSPPRMEPNSSSVRPIRPPIINNFAASPGSIAAGQSSTLTWDVSNVDRLTINPEPGNVATAGGNAIVSPSTTTTYTLIASNDTASVTATVQVIVTTQPVITDSNRPKLLSPPNGSTGVHAKSVVFRWYPFNNTTRYHFILAKDEAITYVIWELETQDTKCEYHGWLDFSTNYYWKVQAADPVLGEWSDPWTFQTEFPPAPE
jgi:hypothetical protein